MKFIFFLLQTINTLIPKSQKKIMFISRPDFADNTKHMYSYMQKKVSDKQLSWLIYDKEIYTILIHNKHENIFYLKSLKGIWEYLRSKTIITSSSSLWQIKSPLQNQFDLWHGIPLKNVLCMGEKNVKPVRQAGNITMRFATSSLEKALLAASFDFNALKIAITGQPRTDALFSKENNLSEFLGKDTMVYNKVVMYMPTYRTGYKNKNEGNTFEQSNILRLMNYDHSTFMHFLEKHKILFLLKLHPYEEKQYENLKLGKNIIWINNKQLIDKNFSVHDILGNIDILITDYSSIYFDFLLLDKKIIFLPTDLSYYKDNRGFELEPYDFWTPGEKVFSQTPLEEKILKDDTKEEAEKRKVIRNIMFTYQDSNSAQRVFDEINKKIRL